MIEVINLDDGQKWDSIVKSFKEYDVYYLSGYVKAFWINGDGEPILLHFEGNGIEAINVVMKRDIATDEHFKGILEKSMYYDLVTPYGYGGWLVGSKMEKNDVNTERMLFDEYTEWCMANNIISEFVRFHPVLLNHRFAIGLYEVIPLGSTVAMDLSTPDAIWANLTSKNRNMIRDRKAMKSGIKIYNGRCPELYHEFHQIYNATMDKDEADAYYYFGKQFYDSILYDLSQNAQVFYAVLENKVIAASIILASNGYLNYHLSGSVREYQSLAPTNLLLYEAALWGNTNGCKIFHLGGGVGSGEDSLYKFKKAFNRGEGYRFHIGRKIFCPEMYEELVSYRRNDVGFKEDSAFFPLYRA